MRNQALYLHPGSRMINAAHARRKCARTFEQLLVDETQSTVLGCALGPCRTRDRWKFGTKADPGILKRIDPATEERTTRASQRRDGDAEMRARLWSGITIKKSLQDASKQTLAGPPRRAQKGCCRVTLQQARSTVEPVLHPLASWTISFDPRPIVRAPRCRAASRRISDSVQRCRRARWTWIWPWPWPWPWTWTWTVTVSVEGVCPR